MQSVFKTILGILIVAMILSTGLGILWANNQAVAANEYVHTVADEISTANLRDNVIEACKQQAQENGYVLETEYISENPDGTRNNVVITLRYRYTVGIVALSGWHEKTLTVY